jgi:hypothetical protein
MPRTSRSGSRREYDRSLFDSRHDGSRETYGCAQWRQFYFLLSTFYRAEVECSHSYRGRRALVLQIPGRWQRHQDVAVPLPTHRLYGQPHVDTLNSSERRTSSQAGYSPAHFVVKMNAGVRLQNAYRRVNVLPRNQTSSSTQKNVGLVTEAFACFFRKLIAGGHVGDTSSEYVGLPARRLMVEAIPTA